jgi:hypothetical protein
VRRDAHFALEVQAVLRPPLRGGVPAFVNGNSPDAASPGKQARVDYEYERLAASKSPVLTDRGATTTGLTFASSDKLALSSKRPNLPKQVSRFALYKCQACYTR